MAENRLRKSQPLEKTILTTKFQSDSRAGTAIAQKK